jgi:hypothetical protein
MAFRSIGAANLGRVAESRPQAAGAVKPQGGLDLLNVAALAVERRPLGAIGKDEDRVGGAGKSGRAAHGVEVHRSLDACSDGERPQRRRASIQRSLANSVSSGSSNFRIGKTIFTSRE